ncbi:copper resistance CopC family protein [Leucobacter sp. W1478]|uniref:copper resistance CopC family protein n=1 Tax=Leucobacter sp. W1478 TaxID=3439065 RepID=UPI003F2E1AA8
MRAFTLARVPARTATPQKTTPTRSRIAAIAAAGFALVALTFGSAAPALAHDELVGFDVVSDEGTGEVQGFSLQFNNEILDVGAEFIATDAEGADALDGPPVVDGRTVTQALQTPTTAGNVAIAWRVVSSDGHPISGALTLTVAQDGSGTIALAEAGSQAGGSDDQSAPEVTTQLGENSGGDTAETSTTFTGPWVWVLVAVGVAGVVAALGGALIIGSRRRAQTFGDDGHTPGSAPTTD